MAFPIIPVILATLGLVGGVTQGIQAKQNAENEKKALREKTQAQINERARQAIKLMSEQKSSFLKSGIYFNGTPEEIINETYDTSMEDINAMIADANQQEKNLSKQGNSDLMNGILGGVSSAALSFFGANGFGNLFSGSSSGGNLLSKIGSSRLGTSMSNMWNSARGLNTGGFGSLPTKGFPTNSSIRIV